MTAQKPPYSLTLAGCGKMGGALLQNWINQKLLGMTNIIEPHPVSAQILAHKNIKQIQNPAGFPISSDVLILAVKPQILTDVAEQLKSNLSPETLVISIAAGQSLQTLENLFNPKQPIIRSMPNTPAAIGKGITAGLANAHVTGSQKILAETLFATTGKFEWIKDESLMDSITALSGSGPAYLFYFIEALAKAGENIGLAPDFAMTLARQTIIGSAALAETEHQTPAAILRQNVTSPAGTTEAALRILMNGNFDEILNQALAAAKKRGQELNKN